MSCCLRTPSGFALYLHGNICHGPKSWCRGSPRVCCRRLVEGLLSLWLIPLVRMPNIDASKHREGGRSLALGGRRWVIRHNNQPIVSGSDRRDDGEDARPGWSIWGGWFSDFVMANWTTKKITKIKFDGGLRWPPFDILSPNNQPRKTSGRDGGGMGGDRL